MKKSATHHIIIDLLIQRKWLTLFYQKIQPTRNLPNYRTKLLSTPEYTLIDILRMGIDPYFAIKHLWNDQFYKMNLFNKISRINIPVCFLAGRHDYFTPSEIVETFFHKLEAPEGKDLIWFEHSGHNPETDEPLKFNHVMIKNVMQKILHTSMTGSYESTDR